MDPLKSPSPQEAKLHFLDYWRIIRIRKTVILSVFILVALTATLVTYILPVSYSSTARIRVDRDVPDIPGFDPRTGVPSTYDPYFIETEFQVIKSEVVLGKVITNLDLNHEWGKKFNGGQTLKTPDTMEMLKHRIDLSPVRNASIIEIQVYSDKAEEAAKLANTIAETYKEYRFDLLTQKSERGIKVLQKQYEDQEEKVHQVQTNVDYLRENLNIPDSLANQIGLTPLYSSEILNQLTGQRYQEQNKYVEKKTLWEKLKDLSHEDLKKALPLVVTDQELNTLVGELNEAQLKLIEVGRDHTPEHPLYQTQDKLVKALEQKVNDRIDGVLFGVKTDLDKQKAKLDDLVAQVDQAKGTNIEQATKWAPYFEAKRKLEELQTLSKALQNRIFQEETELALPKVSMVQITDRAYPGEDPVRPKKSLNIILGVIVGLIVGVGLAFFIEYLDTSVKTIDDVERTLQAPVLGVIPQNVGLVIQEGADSPHAEAYRVLRTNILFSRKDDKLNTVVVVSAGAGEGKSTTVFNLATVFAQSGHRVLMVDSDLRRPSLHKMLAVTNNLGLTNYLLEQNTLEDVIQTTPLATLDLLASGKLPSSSLGILSSSQMKSLIGQLKQRYDFVFFDSPPIMGVSDASILASEVDMTLQVIQYRRYPQPMNIRAKQMIEKVGGNLVGIVLNNINMSQDESYYYYSGYYHEYYSKNEGEVQSSPASAASASGDSTKTEIKPKY
jgi:polysaccharide biosynthesis transport protein